MVSTHSPGHVEQQVYSDLTFKTQQRSFHVLGYAANPSILDTTGSLLVGDMSEAFKNNGDSINDVRISKADMRAMKRKRKGKGALGVFDDEDEEEEEEVVGEEVGEDGVMVPIKVKKQKVQKEYVGPWAGWEDQNLGTVGPTVEEWEEQEERGGAPLNKEQRKRAVVDAGKKEIGFGEEKSTFHGKLPLSYADLSP